MIDQIDERQPLGQPSRENEQTTPSCSEMSCSESELFGKRAVRKASCSESELFGNELFGNELFGNELFGNEAHR